MSKLLTLTQAESIANAVLGKVKDKGYAVADDLGALASKDEVAKTDLASALVTEIEGKADTADLGDLAALDEVAESNLASELATKINGKADAATTIAGYGITDAYTKTETDGLISGAYRAAGTIAGSALTSSLLIASNKNKVYNISSDLNITAENEGLFLNLSAGDKVKAGDDVGVVEVEEEEGSTTVKNYYFNKFSAFVDLSGVTYTEGNGIDIDSNNVVSVKIDTANANGLDVTASGVKLGTASGSTNGALTSSDWNTFNGKQNALTEGNGIDITSNTISAKVSTGNGLSNGSSGIAMATVTASTSGTGGSNGAMLATDKEKLDDIQIATTSEVNTMIEGLDSL